MFYMGSREIDGRADGGGRPTCVSAESNGFEFYRIAPCSDFIISGTIFIKKDQFKSVFPGINPSKFLTREMVCSGVAGLTRYL